MIIGTNRFSSVNGRISIGINENYGAEDLGRIMMEDVRNDMAIFNAALMADVREIKARQEGTLLESELMAMNEGAVKDFFKAIIEKLKKFWEKMKGFFKAAIANISAYIVRDGATFVKMHEKSIAKLKPDDECGDVWVLRKSLEEKNTKVSKAIKTEIEKSIHNIAIEKANSDRELPSVSDVKKGIYEISFEKYDDSKSVYENFRDECFEEKTNATVKDVNITAMKTRLLNGKQWIKNAKECEKNMNKVITDAIKECEKAANTLIKDRYNDKDNEENKEVRANINKGVDIAKNTSSALTACVSESSKAAIKCIKFDMAQCRKAIAHAIGYNSKQESTLLESILVEADEEIEALSDNDYASDLTPAEEKAVEDLVEAIEDKLDDGCSDDDD